MINSIFDFIMSFTFMKTSGAIGSILANNYVDKTTGEDKKFYKIRISKLIEHTAVQQVRDSFAAV